MKSKFKFQVFPSRQNKKKHIGLFIFWEKLWLDNFVSRSTYPYFTTEVMLVRTASEASREGGLEASLRLLSLEKIGELEASTQGPPNLGHIRLSHGGPSKRKVYLYNIVLFLYYCNYRGKILQYNLFLEKGNWEFSFSRQIVVGQYFYCHWPHGLAVGP